MKKIEDHHSHFITKVNITPNFHDCWEWKAYRSKKGYGQYGYQGTIVAAHRVSYMLYCGPVGDFNVCHHCDNPPCVNPVHLFLGTQKDNIFDMRRKKRGEKLRHMTHASDETHQVSKLTNDEVRFIRTCGLTEHEVEKILNYKVKRLAIVRARTGQTYKDVK